MNIDLLKKRLGEISNKNKRNNCLWKPSDGTQNIRLVPYKEQPDNPFIELKFHYDFNGKTYLSPSTFGRPDPIVEIAQQLRKSGDPDDYKLGTKLMPKLRIYAPVIVRGEEDEGVRFWGFGKTVYQSLLGFVADEDYGDITDIKEGNDITVEYIPKEQTGKNFPETQIRPRPKKTKVGDASVIEAIKNQPSIMDMYEEPSYDELKTALEKYLNPEDGSSNDDSDVDDEDLETDTPDDTEEKSVSEKKVSPKASSKDVASDFDTLFSS
jgi:hypothetical protein